MIVVLPRGIGKLEDPLLSRIVCDAVHLEFCRDVSIGTRFLIPVQHAGEIILRGRFRTEDDSPANHRSRRF